MTIQQQFIQKKWNYSLHFLFSHLKEKETNDLMLKEKMFVEYKNMKGQITFVDKSYAVFNPFNSKALLVVYKENWVDVTVL